MNDNVLRRNVLNINEILSRSAQLEEILTGFLALKLYDESDRRAVSKILCSVAFEHAESLKMLIASGNFTSAVGLLRLQYEAFVRATWILFAASDTWVAKMMAELTQDSMGAANKVPMLSKMLQELESRLQKDPMKKLLQFKEYSWKPLSSYVHGGLHAVNRHSKGYPPPLLAQTLKASNGLSIMTGMLLVILSGDPVQSGKIGAIQLRYLDCLPDLEFND